MYIDSKFRVSLSYGWSRRMSNISGRLSSQEMDFAKELQSGQNIRLSFHHYPEGNFGIGLKFNQFSTSHSDEITVFDGQTGLSSTDIVSEEISATMYGLSGVGREQFGDSFQLNYGVSLGVFVLKSDASGFSRRIAFEEISLCGEGEFSLDFFITENLAIGTGAAIQIAPFEELREGRVFVNSFDFNRIDLFGGIRAYF